MTHSDRGLGLLEIVISMFLISLIAIAFVPVLMAGLQASQANSTTATAVRLVAQGIDEVRAAEPSTCAELATLGSVRTVIDGQGETLQLTVTVPDVDDCSPDRAQLVRASAIAVDGSAEPLAEARLLVALRGGQ